MSDAPSTPPTKRKHVVMVVAAILALALIVAVGLYVSGSFKKTTKVADLPIGANVLASSDAAPKELTAKETTEPSPVIETAVSLGPVIDITPGGQLSAPLTLKFQLSQTVASDVPVFVAWRSQPTDEWDVQQATLSNDGRFATIVTSHLSWYWPFSFSVGDMFNSVKQEVIDALTGESTEQATHPKCENEATARQDNYSITSSDGPTLYWCFGVENVDGKDQRVVRITNRLRYPINITPSGFQTPADPRLKPMFQLELQNLARLGSAERNILFPFETMTYTTELGMNEVAQIETSYSGWAQHLHRLDLVISTLLAIVTKLGGKAIGTKSRDRLKMFDEMLEAKDCLNAVIDLDLGRSIVNCFNPSQLKKWFDWRGVLLSPLITAGSLFNWLRGELNSFFDQFNSRSNYKIVVQRTNLADKFVGDWRVHDISVTFSQGGTGKMIQNEGPCNYTHTCFAHMNLTWKMDGERLVFTITSYSSIDDSGQPPFDTGRASEIVGESARVEYVRQGFLRVTWFAPDLIDNFVLCGNGAGQADRSTCKL